jgi:hypothetical protein
MKARSKNRNFKTALRQKAAAGLENTAHKQHSRKLEETISYSNLTDFRSSLLQIIPRLQENEYLRFIITKHGEPAAVVMSHQAYLLMKDVTSKVMEQEAEIDPETDLHNAYLEMTGKTLPLRPESVSPEVTTGQTIAHTEIKKVKDLLRMAVDEYIKATRPAEIDEKLTR